MPEMNLTKLQGVNRILKAARQRPVSSLGVTTQNDSLQAEAKLDEILVREQMTGQHVNTTMTAFPLDPMTNKIPLPSNTLLVQASNEQLDRSYFHKEVNGAVLLFDGDATPATSDFGPDGVNTDPATVLITQAMDFEELPAQHQFSIVDQAAVEYQEETLGDDALGAKLEARAGRSRAMSRAYDMDSARHNQLRDSQSSLKFGRIPNRPYGDQVTTSQGTGSGDGAGTDPLDPNRS